MLKVTRLDCDSTLQEIVDAAREFNMFCEENDLCGDFECRAASMSGLEIENKNEVLEKTAKNFSRTGKVY